MRIDLIGSEDKKIYDLLHFPLRDSLGGLMNLNWQAEFDKTLIRPEYPGLWRYRNFIPIKNDENIISLGEGNSPLLGLELSGRQVYIKQEHIFPTGSYKDRGASVLMSLAKELKVKKVIQDSSGNAGCSIAAYAAACGISCEIFVPENTAEAKLIQIKAYGAQVNKVKGNREDTANAALKEAKNHYYASHCYHPYFYQGTKTFAYEVCEQLNWQAPDHVILPAGNGTLIIGAYLGFKELYDSKVISSIPKIHGVQAKDCCPLFDQMNNQIKETSEYQKREVIAEGIAIAAPVRGGQIIEIIKETGGKIWLSSDDDTKIALKNMVKSGFYIEPTSAATIAGLVQFLETERNPGLVVSLFSGHGLKSSDKIAKIL